MRAFCMVTTVLLQHIFEEVYKSFDEINAALEEVQHYIDNLQAPL
jgi:hypothetical protein